MGVAGLKFNLDIRPHFLRVLWLRLDTPKDNPSLTPIDSNSSVDIVVFSGNEEWEVSLEAKADRILPISIISKATAHRQRIPYIEIQREPVEDSEQTRYLPIGKADLRWHKRDAARSYSETFYVVNTTSDLVILGATAFPEDNESGG